ncbi:amidohydrolase family protein [Pseudarthrobacter sp. So.54]
MPVDLLIRNAHILTQDASRPTATSLLIHDGKILDVEPDPALAGSAARTIDAAGLTVVPGFNDVHAHSVWFGLGLMEANLGTVRSLADVYRIIADAADGLAPGDWVVASGFSPLLIGGQQPDRDRLDAAAAWAPGVDQTLLRPRLHPQWRGPGSCRRGRRPQRPDRRRRRRRR